MIPSATILQHCNYSSQEEYRDQVQSVGLGVSYLILGIFFLVCYLPCIAVMLKKDLWSNICYKLMFFDGVYDIGTLISAALLPGVIMIAPFDYSCYPLINQFIIDIFALFWNASLFSTASLAINRLIFLTSPVVWTERLYGGKRVWIWPGMAISLGIANFIAYRSQYATLIVDTKLGIYLWPVGDIYGHTITTIANIVTAISLFIPYVLTLYALRNLTGTVTSSQMTAARRMEQRMIIQVMVICSLTITTCFCYPFAPLLTTDIIVFQALEFIWISSHGCTGVLFLCLNPTIREEVFALIRVKGNKISGSQIMTAWPSSR